MTAVGTCSVGTADDARFGQTAREQPTECGALALQAGDVTRPVTEKRGGSAPVKVCPATFLPPLFGHGETNFSRISGDSKKADLPIMEVKRTLSSWRASSNWFVSPSMECGFLDVRVFHPSLKFVSLVPMAEQRWQRDAAGCSDTETSPIVPPAHGHR